MPTLHIENVPASVVDELAEQAAREGKGTEQRAVELLQLGLETARRDRKWIDERLAASDSLRAAAPGAWTTEDLIRAGRDEGRA